jgi:hypothetical protein
MDRATVEIFSIYSPIIVFMFGLPPSRLCDFLVACKGCGEKVPAPVETMPASWIIASCPPLRREAPIPAAGDFSGQNVHEAREKAGSVGGSMGEMRRANAHEEERRIKDRFASTLVIAASVIAAVRLAREPDITRPSPRLLSVIADSVQLAKRILDTVMR